MARANERQQIKGITAELRTGIEGSMKGLAREITVTLSNRTPKASGLAAASWIPSVGESVDKPPSRRRNSAGVKKAAAAKQKGLAEVEEYRLEDGEIYITNGLPYVLQIQEGTSKQAPRPFVEQAIDEAVERT